MPKKTNKTSHVLSLLTNGADPEEISGQDLSGERNTKKQEKAGTEAAPMESVQKVSSSVDKMVVVVDDQEENISNRIFDKAVGEPGSAGQGSGISERRSGTAGWGPGFRTGGMPH